MGAAGGGAEKRVRGGGRDLLVRGDEDGVAQIHGGGGALERGERGEHDRDAALHVGDAGAVQVAGCFEAGVLERMIGGVNRVHVAGQQDLHGRIRANDLAQMVAVRARANRAVRANDLRGHAVDQLQRAAERGKGMRERLGLEREAGEVVAP